MFAVDGARVSVAVLLSRDRITCLAAVGNVGDDGLRASLDTATAYFGAGSPGSPSGEDAIDGASLSVADAKLRVMGACDATVSYICHN